MGSGVTVGRALSYTEFVASLGVTFEAGQYVLCRVAFDGVDPVDLPLAERAVAAELFGPDVDRVPPAARDVFVCVIGGRAGKSYLLCGLRMLHLALTVPLDGLAPGERASANIVAPDLDLAQQTLSFAAGAARAHPKLAAMIAADNTDGLVLRRGSQFVTVKCRAASGKGKTGRGRSLVGFALDEAAIFRDADHKVNDEEIYKANVPRVMRGGQAVVASTAWGKGGLLYDLWRANHNSPTTCLVAHAPTTAMRSNAKILRQVAAEFVRDHDNARREFGAEFMSGASGAFFDGDAVDHAVVGPAPPPPPGAIVTAGGDLGFVNDASALVIVYRVGDVYHVHEVLEMRPAEGAPLRPSEVIRAFAEACERHRVYGLMVDVHYREAVREAVERVGVPLLDAPEGANGKVASYTKAKALLHEGRVRLPDNARLLRQLREVTSRPTSGGGLSITSPRGAGGHGDLVSALVLALWQASGHEVEAPTEAGSPEWYAERDAARRAALAGPGDHEASALLDALAARQREGRALRNEMYGGELDGLFDD